MNPSFLFVREIICSQFRQKIQKNTEGRKAFVLANLSVYKNKFTIYIIIQCNSLDIINNEKITDYIDNS